MSFRIPVVLQDGILRPIGNRPGAANPTTASSSDVGQVLDLRPIFNRPGAANPNAALCSDVGQVGNLRPIVNRPGAATPSADSSSDVGQVLNLRPIVNRPARSTTQSCSLNLAGAPSPTTRPSPSAPTARLTIARRLPTCPTCRFRVCPTFLLAIGLAAAAPHPDIVIRNITVVDVKTGNLLPHESVLIHGDRIQSIASTVRAAANAEAIDGRGKYLIPGLWDMHVHLWYKENQFPMYLAWGITGLRDMGSDLNRVKQWRREIKAGERLGPHIETCGPAVDGFPSDDPKLPVITLRTPADARKIYDHLEQDLNVDFIKVLSRVPRDAYFALIDRARKWGLPVVGHVPYSVMVDEAITERQSSIEHLSNVLLACSTEERKMLLPRSNAMERNDTAAILTFAERELATFDARKAETLFERMARFYSYQTPTLVMLRRSAYADSDEVVRDPHLKFIPADIRKTWDDPREVKKKLPEPTLALMARRYEKYEYVVDRMQRAGVPILAGTDTGDPYTFPGYELHRELQLLVNAGLSPLQALRSATLTPAEFLDADESLGSVSQGKMADLVLLDGDPLKDIHNTQKISAVIVGGKYLSRAKLDALMREAEK